MRVIEMKFVGEERRVGFWLMIDAKREATVMNGAITELSRLPAVHHRDNKNPLVTKSMS
jgi:hypothetical protein